MAQEVDGSSSNWKVAGLIFLVPPAACRSILEQDTEPKIAPCMAAATISVCVCVCV